jgi:outer membrane protein assembly factor BamB
LPFKDDRLRGLAAAVVPVVVAAAALVTAQGRPDGAWPQYLGPQRNNVAASPIEPGAALTVAWRVPLAPGTAGLAVSSRRAYTLGSEGERDYLIALNAADGEEIWRVPLGATHADAASGPGATPAVAGDLVIALGSACSLVAVRPDGTTAWQRGIGTEYRSRFAERGGCRMSPLVVDGRVILATGAATGARLVALDAATGKDAWAVTDLPGAPNMAVGLRESGGARQVIYLHAKPPGIAGLSAVDARNGSVLWQVDGTRSMSDTTPLAVGPDRILMQTWAHSTVFEAGGRPAPIWSNDELSALGPPPVVHGGHIFGFGGNSGEFLKCVDARTGEARWSSRIYRGYAVLAGDTIVVLSESSGLVRLVAADPASYRELARVQALTPGARTSTPPAVAGGRIFVRNLEEVVAITAR